MDERYFWLVFIGVTVLNAFFLKVSSRPEIKRDPRLTAGYKKLFVGVLFWGNLPWLVMGLGILLGEVSRISEYFNVRSGNPFVFGFLAVVVAEWLLGIWWLFARQGAEFLVMHPGLLRGRPSATSIRVGYCFALAGGVLALIVAGLR